MSQTLIVHGHYREQHFIPDEPLSFAEGSAEMVITTLSTPSRGSIADTFGKGTIFRTAEDINEQIREERDTWGDR